MIGQVKDDEFMHRFRTCRDSAEAATNDQGGAGKYAGTNSSIWRRAGLTWWQSARRSAAKKAGELIQNVFEMDRTYI